MDREVKSGVERLKNELYARDRTPSRSVRSTLAPVGPEAPRTWAADETAAPPSLHTSARRPRMSGAAKFLTASAIFFIAAAGVAAYVFFGGANITSPQNIDVEIIAPSLVDGGKEVQFEIVVRNRNTTPLELAELVIQYPPGTRSAKDPTETVTHERQTIGVIRSGEEVKRTAHALIYGEEGEQKTLAATLEYSVANSNATFERRGEVQFLVGSAPVSLTVSSPEETVAGQPFAVTITVRSNVETPVNHLVVKGEYPFGFSILNSDPKADAGGVWRLGTLQPGASRTIHLFGTIEGSDGDERVFRFIAGSNDDDTDPNVKVPYLTVPKTLTVTRPFIGGTIIVGGQSSKNVAVAPGASVQGRVVWQNNFPEPVSDVELTLYFNGPAIVPGSIEGTRGFFQSSNNSLIWTKDQNSDLAQVAPGESGTFNFSFRTKTAGSGGTLITNPVIDLNLSVRAVRSSGAPEVIDSAAATRVNVASALSLTTNALHFTGPFANTGPMPPRAEEATTYSIVWTVKNSSNAVGNGEVSATLPPYVSFVKAEEGSGITYNPGSRTVIWNVGDIKAGVGYTTGARSAAFQVELKPSSSQVGEVPILVHAATLSGVDRFAQVPLTAQTEVVTTRLVSDPQFQSGMDTVAPRQ